MDPLTIAALANVGGSIAGNLLSRGDRDAARANQEEALALFRNIKTPDVKDQQVSYDKFQLQGLLSNLLQANPEDLQETELTQVTTDPRLRSAQMKALETLQSLGKAGLTPEEQAQAQRMQQQSQAQEAARQASIMQNMAARGVGGSGVEAAARLVSSQGAANAQAASSDELRALAFNRMLQATSQGGDLGNRMENTQYAQKSTQAQAQDAINKFNQSQRADTLRANTERQRAVEEGNLRLRQTQSDSNTRLANEQQQYNKELIQQQFNNQRLLASQQADALGNMAKSNQQRAQDTAGMISGITSGIGGIAGAFGANKTTGTEPLASKDITNTQLGKRLLNSGGA